MALWYTCNSYQHWHLTATFYSVPVFIQKRQLLWLSVCFPTCQVCSEEGFSLKRRNLLTKGSKCFPFRIRPFSDGKSKNNLNRVASTESVSSPLKCSCELYFNHFIFWSNSKMRGYLKFYRLSDATFYNHIKTIYQLIKPFLDKKYLFLGNMESLNYRKLMVKWNSYKCSGSFSLPTFWDNGPTTAVSALIFNPCPTEPGYILFCKQCRSRSVGFWRSQLIWICTVHHQVCKFITTIWIK